MTVEKKFFVSVLKRAIGSNFLNVTSGPVDQGTDNVTDYDLLTDIAEITTLTYYSSDSTVFYVDQEDSDSINRYGNLFPLAKI